MSVCCLITLERLDRFGQTFFMLAPYWSGNGFRPKKSGFGIRFFRKSGKIENRFWREIINIFTKIFEFSCEKSPK